MVVVHGGYWRARFDRSLMTGLCLDLAAHGLAAWNLEYRRVGAGGGWPETFLDVAAGVDALADVDAPLDLGRVAAVGHSAGGQLAMWAAARPRLLPDAPGAEPRVEIGAVVSQAGVLDLRLAAALNPSAEPTRALLGDPGENPEAYDVASPVEHLPLRIPQLVLHGDRDETVSMRIAESYAARARDMGDTASSSCSPDRALRAHRRRLRRLANRARVARGLRERRAELSDERLERLRAVLGGEERRGADDDAVRQLRRGRGMRGARHAEARVERNVGEPPRRAPRAAQARARARPARPSCR